MVPAVTPILAAILAGALCMLILFVFGVTDQSQAILIAVLVGLLVDVGTSL